MRLVLLTLDSLASAAAVRRFLKDHADQIALVGISNPDRRTNGGKIGQTRLHLSRSGPGFLPYLLVNFALPEFWAGLHGTSLAALCRELGLPHVKVDDVRGAAFAEQARAADADLIISFHFDQILDDATLRLARHGGINVHPSLLPAHRGPIPTLYAALERPPCFGVTVHRLVEKIDAGPILAQQPLALPDGVSVSTAARLLHDCGAVLLTNVLKNFPALDNAAKAGVPTPYCPFPSRQVLREARRRGVRLSRLSDLLQIFRIF